MNRRWLRALLGLIALVMLGDFIFRGIVPALGPGKNDFSEVYVGAWMWRHGLNFYDASLATATGDLLGNTRVNIALVYPPTALVLIAPFTFLPWSTANLVWFLLGLAGIAVTIGLLIRLAGLQMWEDRALILTTFVLAFDPLHQGFHLGNVALFAVPLCFLGVYLAGENRDLSAGLVLGIACALKPQLGIWFLIFYLVLLRMRIFLGALVPAAALALAFVRYPVRPDVLFSSYRSNLHYWFGLGRLYGFTEGALTLSRKQRAGDFLSIVPRCPSGKPAVIRTVSIESGGLGFRHVARPVSHSHSSGSLFALRVEFYCPVP